MCARKLLTVMKFQFGFCYYKVLIYLFYDCCRRISWKHDESVTQEKVAKLPPFKSTSTGLMEREQKNVIVLCKFCKILFLTSVIMESIVQQSLLLHSRKEKKISPFVLKNCKHSLH